MLAIFEIVKNRCISCLSSTRRFVGSRRFLLRREDPVCRAERVPAGVQSEDGWACLRFVGPFAFGATGIVLSMLAPKMRSVYELEC